MNLLPLTFPGTRSLIAADYVKRHDILLGPLGVIIANGMLAALHSFTTTINTATDSCL